MSFDVWWTPTAIASAQGLDRPVARRVDEAEAELERVGCAAAGYRLTGEPAERICVVHLVYDCRMLTAFPSAREVAILLIGRHTRSPSLDVYARLYRALGTGMPAGERTKPPCCDEDEVPRSTNSLSSAAVRVSSGCAAKKAASTERVGVTEPSPWTHLGQRRTV